MSTPWEKVDNTVAVGYAGLYTKANPTTLRIGEAGLAHLSKCANVDIGDQNQLSVRHGFDRIVAASLGSIHSCFSTPNLGFIVFCEQDALSLYHLGDQEVTRIRNISPNKLMNYEINGGLIHYTNTVEQGVIEIAQLTTKPWEIETDYHGPKTSRTFSNPPVGSIIHFYKSRMYVALGRNVFISEPFDVNRFVLDEGNILLSTQVRMISSTDNCLLVGLDDELVCYVGANPSEAVKVKLIDSPAINGTQQKAYPSDLGLEGKDIGVILTTAKGIVFIHGDGTLIKLSEDKIDIPDLSRLTGCSAIKNGKYICQLHVKT